MNYIKRKRFWYLVKQLNHFASGWKSEYLVDLREFHRNRSTGEVRIQEGDIVLIKEDNLKRNQWKMGLVKKFIQGKDGVVRRAKVRISSKGKEETLNRPLQRLFPLEIKKVRKEDGEKEWSKGDMGENVEGKETAPLA